jgi:hypothetical protein
MLCSFREVHHYVGEPYCLQLQRQRVRQGSNQQEAAVSILPSFDTSHMKFLLETYRKSKSGFSAGTELLFIFSADAAIMMINSLLFT